MPVSKQYRNAGLVFTGNLFSDLRTNIYITKKNTSLISEDNTSQAKFNFRWILWELLESGEQSLKDLTLEYMKAENKKSYRNTYNILRRILNGSDEGDVVSLRTKGLVIKENRKYKLSHFGLLFTIHIFFEIQNVVANKKRHTASPKFYSEKEGMHKLERKVPITFDQFHQFYSEKEDPYDLERKAYPTSLSALSNIRCKEKEGLYDLERKAYPTSLAASIRNVSCTREELFELLIDIMRREADEDYSYQKNDFGVLKSINSVYDYFPLLFEYIGYIRNDPKIDLSVFLSLLDINEDFNDSKTLDVLTSVRYEKGQFDAMLDKIIPSMFWIKVFGDDPSIELPLKASVILSDIVDDIIANNTGNTLRLVEITSKMDSGLLTAPAITDDEQKVIRDLAMELVQTFEKYSISSKEVETHVRPLISSIKNRK